MYISYFWLGFICHLHYINIALNKNIAFVNLLTVESYEINPQPKQSIDDWF